MQGNGDAVPVQRAIHDRLHVRIHVMPFVVEKRKINIFAVVDHQHVGHAVATLAQKTGNVADPVVIDGDGDTVNQQQADGFALAIDFARGFPYVQNALSYDVFD